MHLPITRRAALRAGLFTWLATRWPRALFAQAETSANEFSFIAVNDLHYQEEACAPFFERIIEAMRKSAPEAAFCLVSGDLADQGKPEQLAGVRAALQKFARPIYAVPGNHDHLTDSDRRGYEENFPNQTNYHFTHSGWQFVGLDSSDGTKWQNTRISGETLAWMDETLPKLDRERPTVVFTHFPLGEGVTYRPANADEALRRLNGYNVQAIFSGHWHGFSERKAGAITLTTDRCCSRVRGNHDGSKEKGWFVCVARGGRIERTFVEAPAA